MENIYKTNSRNFPRVYERVFVLNCKRLN